MQQFHDLLFTSTFIALFDKINSILRPKIKWSRFRDGGNQEDLEKNYCWRVQIMSPKGFISTGLRLESTSTMEWVVATLNVNVIMVPTSRPYQQLSTYIQREEVSRATKPHSIVCSG